MRTFSIPLSVTSFVARTAEHGKAKISRKPFDRTCALLFYGFGRYSVKDLQQDSIVTVFRSKRLAASCRVPTDALR